MIRKALYLSLISIFLGLSLSSTSPVKGQTNNSSGVVVLEAQGQILQFSTSSVAFTFPLTLQETTLQTGSDVELQIGSLVRADGQVGPQAQLQVALQPSGGISLHLNPGDVASFQLTGELPSVGTYHSWLEIKTGQGQSLYTLVITRAAPSDLLILGAQSGIESFSTPGENFQSTLYLELASGQPVVDDLVLTLTDIRRIDGKVTSPQATLSCDVCGEEKNIVNPAKPFPIVLTAMLPEPAAYQSLLTLQYQNHLQVVIIQFTRLSPQTNLSLSVSSPFNVMRPLSGGVVANLNFAVTELSGRNEILFLPTTGLFSLSDKTGNIGGYSGEEQAVFLSGTTTSLPSTAIIPIGANTTQQMILRVSGLNQPGTYQSSISISGPESARVSQPFVINVRDNWKWAFFCITIGVFLAFVSIGVTRWILPRLEFKKQVAHEQEALTKTDIPDTDEVAKFLKKELEELEENPGFPFTFPITFTPPTQRFNDLSLRRQTYTNIYSLYQAACRSLSGTQWLGRLNYALENLQKELKIDPDNFSLDAQTAKKMGDDFQNKVDELEGDSLVEPAKLLQKTLQEIISEAQELSAKAKNLVDSLNAQMTAASKDPAAFRNFLDDMQFKIADLRLSQGQNNIQRMQMERLKTIKPDDPAWNKVEEEFKPLSLTLADLKNAISQHKLTAVVNAGNEASHLYLAATIAHLNIMAGPLGCPNDIKPEKWQNSLKQKPQLSKDLEQAEKAFKKKEYEKATDYFKQAQSEYLAVLLPVRMDRIFQQLTNIKPDQISMDDWEKLESDAVQKAQEDWRNCSDLLPSPGTPPDQCRDAYQKAHQSFVKAWWQLLEAYSQRVYEYSVQKKIQDRIDLKKIRTKLEEARYRLTSDPSHAEDTIADAHNDLVTLIANLEKPRIESYDLIGKEPPEKISTFPWSGGVSIPGQLPEVSLPAELERILFGSLRIPSEQAIRNLIEKIDWVMLGIGLVLAVVTGICTLYLPNSTWGGTDRLVAILWGIGLQGTVSGLGGVLSALNLIK